MPNANRCRTAQWHRTQQKCRVEDLVPGDYLHIGPGLDHQVVRVIPTGDGNLYEIQCMWLWWPFYLVGHREVTVLVEIDE
jgi:hypothetical protein